MGTTQKTKATTGPTNKTKPVNAHRKMKEQTNTQTSKKRKKAERATIGTKRWHTQIPTLAETSTEGGGVRRTGGRDLDQPGDGGCRLSPVR